MTVMPKEVATAGRVQRMVLERMLQGESEKAIAVHLSISVHTVHAHVKRVYQRCGVKSRAQLFATMLGRLQERLRELDSETAVSPCNEKQGTEMHVFL